MKVTIDGKEREVLTSEEAQAKADDAAKAALEDYQKEHPDQSAELERMKTDLQKAQDDLKAAEDKGGDTGQVRRLREERDAAQKALTEGVGKLTKEFEDFRSGSVNEVKTGLLTKYAGKNEELRKKIEFEFDNYRPGQNSRADIEARMEKAYQLATGNKPNPRMLDGVVSAGARGDGYTPPAPDEDNANRKAMRQVFGITDKQVERAKEVLAKHPPSSKD